MQSVPVFAEATAPSCTQDASSAGALLRTDLRQWSCGARHPTQIEQRTPPDRSAPSIGMFHQHCEMLLPADIATCIDGLDLHVESTCFTPQVSHIYFEQDVLQSAFASM